MRKILVGILFFATVEVEALKYAVKFENEFVTVMQVEIEAGEEIGLHRDALPQVVVALKGGTITRLEANGTETAVEFPTGVPVFRPVDPENELHKSVNRGANPVELIITQLKKS